MKRCLWVFLVLAMLFGSVVFHQWKGYQHIGIAESIVPSFYTIADEDLPCEIKDWIEFSKGVPLVQEKFFQGERYVLITEGKKPTGGYEVNVLSVTEVDGSLVIKVKTTQPKPEDMVTQAITYPYQVIVLKDHHLPLLFMDADCEYRFFMSLVGLHEIHAPIVASSDWIKVFSPKPMEEVHGSFLLTGIANVHEGTVSIELIDQAGEVLFHHFTTAAFLLWGYFEEYLEIPKTMADKGLLKLYSESMKDGSKMFPVTIPLVIKD